MGGDFMKMKKAIIITATLLAIVIAAAIILLPKMLDKTQDTPPDSTEETTANDDRKTEPEKLELPSEDEVFYIKNPALRLEKLTGHITDISVYNDDYTIILGYSEYPLIIRKDLYADPGFSTNSAETEFVIYNRLDNESVMFYGDGEEIKKAGDRDVLKGGFFNNDESIIWMCGDSETKICKLKIMKDGEITVLSENAICFKERPGYRMPYYGFPKENAVIWYADYNDDDDSYNTYLYINGKTGLLGENINIIDETRNTEKIFFSKDGELWVQNRFDKTSRGNVQFSMREPEIQYENHYYPKHPENSEATDDDSALYYYVIHFDNTISIFRHDGESALVFDKTVNGFETFSETENFIYYDNENIYLYDASNAESVLLTEKNDNTVYTALPDLSEIYSAEMITDRDTIYSNLYAIKPNSEKELIDDYIFDFTVSGDTFYYLSGKELYMRKNGKNELLYEFTYNFDSTSGADIEIEKNGYFIVNVHTAVKNDETDSYKSNFFLSTDGRNFVSVEDYVK
jgi:hypothetical protein